jgi:hypothetical protein
MTFFRTEKVSQSLGSIDAPLKQAAEGDDDLVDWQIISMGRNALVVMELEEGNDDGE